LLAWSDDYSDDEDDTAELLAELERIKKERAEDKLRKVVPKPFFF
jgi:protein CWC15